ILLMGQFYEFSLWYFSLKRLVAMSKFECMCIGGIGAYWLFTENKFLRFLQKKTTLIITLVLLPILFVYVSGELKDGLHVVFSVMFLIILLYIVKTKSRPSIENKYLNYLGKISYGLYMYHFAVISVVLHFAKKYLSQESEYIQNLIIYVTVFVLTITVASLSYRFVETPFIKLKSKHSPVKSGD
ncbi:MAG: acyltransferase, partial [Pseudarcicella sp.]|nr:acyltransferase [Pseudarcicella sp.]